MKAVVYETFKKPMTIRSMPDPSPHPDGVVIRVEANGLCRSDWHGWMGHDSDIETLPHVPGHELAGVIEEVGKEVRRWKAGDRVTVPFALGCGSCPQCQSGNQHVCDDYFQPGFTAWGSFAQFVAIRYADVNLVKLPDSIDFVEAASLGCRFITAFRAVAAQGRVEPGEWVVVHGCGGVGLSAIMIANAMGAQVIGVDVKDEALKFAGAIGANSVVNVRQEAHLVEHLKEITGGGAHVSLDALGSKETCINSILNLRKRGRHVQVGVMAAEHGTPAIPMQAVMFNELEIIGSHGMQAHKFDSMMEMIQSGKLQPAKLISKTVTLEESIAELEGMSDFLVTGVVVVDKFD